MHAATDWRQRVRDMQCEEFKQVADSYLSDELLVESNLDVMAHLETCDDCRRDLDARNALRSRLRSAIATDSLSRPRPAFEAAMYEHLRHDALQPAGFFSMLGDGFSGSSFRFAAVAVAVAFVACALYLLGIQRYFARDGDSFTADLSASAATGGCDRLEREHSQRRRRS